MPPISRKSRFITPFSSQTSSVAPPTVQRHSKTPNSRPDGHFSTKSSSSSVSVGPLPKVTPHTRRKIKERFARSLKNQNGGVNFTESPGLPLLIDFSQASQTNGSMPGKAGELEEKETVTTHRAQKKKSYKQPSIRNWVTTEREASTCQVVPSLGEDATCPYYQEELNLDQDVYEFYSSPVKKERPVVRRKTAVEREMVKHDVIKTILKMHLEIQELQRRRRDLLRGDVI